MDWQITIKKVDNGYILEMPRGESTSEEEKIIIDKEVIEIEDLVEKDNRFGTDNPEKIAIGRMLERIAEYFGMLHQKYDSDNLNIKFDLKGSKVD